MALFQAIALAATAIGVAGSIDEAKRSSRAQERSNELTREINRIRNRQARRAFLRRFRAAQAEVLTSGVAAGVGLESSGVQGTISSERSQRNLALNESREIERLGGEIGVEQDKAANAGFRSQVFGQVGSFASQFVSFGNNNSGNGTGSS